MEETATVQSVVKDGLCTGCGTCYSVCPTVAISMVANYQRGTYVPQVNEGKCNLCGICYQVCPGHSVNYEELNDLLHGKTLQDNVLGCHLHCYSGYAVDDSIRSNSASGGLVTAILMAALEEGLIDGALVTRMSRKKPSETESFIARTKEEIISAAGSKYAPATANTALREIMENDGRYAVVGLPCQLSGIRKAEILDEKLGQKIWLHLGLFCIQSQSFQALEFLLWQRGIDTADVTGVKFRGEGWPGSTVIQLKNGDQIRIPFLPNLREIYDASFYPYRCKLCTDPANELSDISFGDAYLPEILETDKTGTSVIVVRSREGEKFLQLMATKGIIRLNELTAAKIRYSHGDFTLKKGTFKVYRFFNKMLGRKVAEHNTTLPPLTLAGIIESVRHLTAGFLSSKRTLWPLLMPYIRLMRFLMVNAGKVLRWLKLERVVSGLRGN